MANIYLISDDYFREQYPEHKNLNMDKFYSTLLIEQNTSLESILGEDLLNYIKEHVQDGLDGDYAELLKKAQYILVFLVARQLTALNTRSADTDARKDVVWQSLTGKISYLKQKIKDFINNSTTLSDVANNDETTSRETGEYPIYFPR